MEKNPPKFRSSILWLFMRRVEGISHRILHICTQPTSQPVCYGYALNMGPTDWMMTMMYLNFQWLMEVKFSWVSARDFNTCVLHRSRWNWINQCAIKLHTVTTSTIVTVPEPVIAQILATAANIIGLISSFHSIIAIPKRKNDCTNGNGKIFNELFICVSDKLSSRTHVTKFQF